MTDTNIFERLRQDHDKQRTLLDLVDKTHGDSRGRRELFERLKDEAEAHAAVEERVFYSVLLTNELTRDKSGHSIEEHKEIEAIFEELEQKPFDDHGWLTRFRTLADKLRHHLEEEEHQIFQLAGKVLNETQKRELAAAFHSQKTAE